MIGIVEDKQKVCLINLCPKMCRLGTPANETWDLQRQEEEQEIHRVQNVSKNPLTTVLIFGLKERS